MKPVLFLAIGMVAICGTYSCKCSQKSEKKTDSESVTVSGLTGKYWKLVELMGKPTVYPAGAPDKAYITFNSDGSLGGNLACNSFSGNYTLKEGSRIEISNLVNTLKMCLDTNVMHIEDELKRVLSTTDHYNLVNNQLILNRARMAPLARFEVIDP